MAARRRGTLRGALALAALGFALLGPCGGGDGEDAAPDAPATEEIAARVVDVVDGDTIGVRLAGGGYERVRYIGIDTPESVATGPLECFGHEAALENRRLVGGRVVHLLPGVERRDDYGRLLAWVRVGRKSVNASLVRRGFARTLTFSPNDARAPEYERLEAAAGRAGAGLWGACAK